MFHCSENQTALIRFPHTRPQTLFTVDRSLQRLVLTVLKPFLFFNSSFEQHSRIESSSASLSTDLFELVSRSGVVTLMMLQIMYDYVSLSAAATNDSFLNSSFCL